MSSGDKLILVFNSSRELVEWDTEGDITLYFSMEKLMGKNVKDIFPERIAFVLSNKIDRCLETGADCNYKYDLGRKTFVAKMYKNNVDSVAVISIEII